MFVLEVRFFYMQYVGKGSLHKKVISGVGSSCMSHRDQFGLPVVRRKSKARSISKMRIVPNGRSVKVGFLGTSMYTAVLVPFVSASKAG